MSNELEKSSELDLQAILKKAEQQTDFPDVPLDEFTPPTYEEWKEEKRKQDNFTFKRQFLFVVYFNSVLSLALFLLLLRFP